MFCSYCDRYHKYQRIMEFRKFVFKIRRISAAVIRILQKIRFNRPNTVGLPDSTVGAIAIGSFAAPFQGGKPVSNILPRHFGHLQYLTR